MDNLKLFSDGLPVCLPLWHSLQSANKKFSMLRNQFDFDTTPDYGGHMLNFDKKTGQYQSIKQDNLGNSPFVIRTPVTPYRISLESSEDVKSNEFNHQCLLYDRNQLINTVSFNHPNRKELIIKKINPNDSGDYDDENNRYREHMDASYGNIEQLNKFVDVGSKLMTHVRQERCINVIEFKEGTAEIENKWYKRFRIESGIEATNSDPKVIERETFFYSDHNPVSCEYLIVGSKITDSHIKISEVDLERNMRCWSKTFQPNHKPSQIKYSTFHPKMFYLSTANNVQLFDTRYNEIGSVKMNMSKLRSITNVDQIRQISPSILNPNQLFVATDHNLILFDNRYPNYVLLQWSHMLSTDSEISFMKNLKLKTETVFIATREEISCISIDKPPSDDVIQPTSLHCPIHLPKLKDLIKSSTISDLRLENFVKKFQIVGLDFVMRNERDFDLYTMNQWGDLFRQKLSTNDDEILDETLLKYESNAQTILDLNLKQYKVKLFDIRQTKLREDKDKKLIYYNRNIKFGYKRPKDRKYSLKFANDLVLDEAEQVKQTMNDSKEELDTTTLAIKMKPFMKSNPDEDNVVINKLIKLFEEDTKEMILKDVSCHKWNDYTIGMIERWNLKQGEQIEKLQDQERSETSQNLTQDYILSQYI